jgi:uncharacterized protein (UPF0216 family)
MHTDPPSDSLIGGYLRDDVRILNAHIPRKRKSLAQLHDEEHPHVICNDGNAHYFRKRELDFLSQMISTEEQRTLLLPIMLEVTHDSGEIIIRTKEGTEAKILSRILNMSIVHRNNKIIIYRPQLSIVRKVLKTSTQYVFFPETVRQDNG